MIDELQNERQRGKKEHFIWIVFGPNISLCLPRILTNCNHQFSYQERELRFNNEKHADDVIIKGILLFLYSIFYDILPIVLYGLGLLVVRGDTPPACMSAASQEEMCSFDSMKQELPLIQPINMDELFM